MHMSAEMQKRKKRRKKEKNEMMRYIQCDQMNNDERIKKMKS